MKDNSLSDFILIWNRCKLHQKILLIGGIPLILFALVFLNVSGPEYVSLFPQEHLANSDATEIKYYLESAHIPFKSKGEKEILVPLDHAHKARMELAAQGLPKQHNARTELSFGNNWMKSDKELHEIEVQALKQQLEQDIAEYENIKSANISLDIASPRPFGGSQNKTKASVQLALKPGARLDNSQLRAITFHIAGAVHGLQPTMIAISDTTGKLYQPIDPDGSLDLAQNEEIAEEEQLKAKIDGMLAMVVGVDNFYSTVQITMNRDKKAQSSNKIESLSIGVMIDKNIVDQPGTEVHDLEILKQEIGSQLVKIVEGYGVQTKPEIDFIAFHHSHISKENLQERSLKEQWMTVGISVLISITLMIIFLTLQRLKKKDSV